jgi:pimeloyl-ACP methyl ester carboxylesterase
VPASGASTRQTLSPRSRRPSNAGAERRTVPESRGQPGGLSPHLWRRPRPPYAPVNGLRMYYEIHGPGGRGRAHPAAARGVHDYRRLRGPAPGPRGLAPGRCVRPAGARPHGRHRPRLSYEGMADDDATLLAHLSTTRADVVRYGMGGGVALQLAVRHRRSSARSCRSRRATAGTRCSPSCSR